MYDATCPIEVGSLIYLDLSHLLGILSFFLLDLVNGISLGIIGSTKKSRVRKRKNKSCVNTKKKTNLI